MRSITDAGGPSGYARDRPISDIRVFGFVAEMRSFACRSVANSYCSEAKLGRLQRPGSDRPEAARRQLWIIQARFITGFTLPTDYTPEFQERVLRRVAERDDLDAVAREFGLPSDLLFAWLRGAVDSGRRLGDSSPQMAQELSAFGAPGANATREKVSQTGANRGLFALLTVFVGSGVVFLLTGASLGFVAASHAFQNVMVASGSAAGLLMFVLLMRMLVSDFAAADVELSAFKLAALATMVGSLCWVSIWMWTLALPSFPHRFFRRPLEVRTVVVKTAIWRGKGGECARITTAIFDTRFPAQEFCIDRGQYNDVRVGEPVVLRGSESWFGIERDGFAFVRGKE